MAAPHGNQYARGKGRASQYVEFQRASYLARCFYEAKEIERIKKKKRHSIFEKMLLKAYDGNVRLMADIFKKLVPDVIQSHQYGKVVWFVQTDFGRK